MEASRLTNITQFVNALRAGDGNALPPLMDCIYQELQALARSQLAREKPGHVLQPTALVHEAYLRLFGGAPVRFENRAHFFAAAAQAMRRILVEGARKRGRIKRGGKARGHHEVCESTREESGVESCDDAQPRGGDSESAGMQCQHYAPMDVASPDEPCDTDSGTPAGMPAFREGETARRMNLGNGPLEAMEAPSMGVTGGDLLDLDDALSRLQIHRPDLAEIVELRFFGGLSVAQTAEALGIATRTVENRWRFARAWLHRTLNIE